MNSGTYFVLMTVIKFLFFFFLPFLCPSWYNWYSSILIHDQRISSDRSPSIFLIYGTIIFILPSLILIWMCPSASCPLIKVREGRKTWIDWEPRVCKTSIRLFESRSILYYLCYHLLGHLLSTTAYSIASKAVCFERKDLKFSIQLQSKSGEHPTEVFAVEPPVGFHVLVLAKPHYCTSACSGRYILAKSPSYTVHPYCVSPRSKIASWRIVLKSGYNSRSIFW